MTSANTLKQIIIEDLKLHTLNQGSQERILDDITELIFRKVMLVVFPKLGEGEKQELEDMLVRGSSDSDIIDFLQAKIIDLDKLVKQEMDVIMTDLKGFLASKK